MLSGNSIQYEEVAVARRSHDQLALLAVKLAIYQDWGLRRIVIMHVMWRGLVVPRHFSGVHVHSDQRAGEEIVFVAPGAGGESWRRVARAENIEPGLWIVSSRDPGLCTAMPRRVQAHPGVQAGIAFLHRDGIVFPLQVAGFRVE